MPDTVVVETVGDRTIAKLSNEKTGARASILASFGFNLYELYLPLAGKVRRVIEAAPNWEQNPGHAGRNGIPILFPFPNRIRDGKFSFEGKSYVLPQNNGPNAIHGFAIQAPWDISDQGVDDHGAFVVGRFQISKNAPQFSTLWPADAVLEVRYTLGERSLTLDAKVSNPSAGKLPFGFGIHPYFSLPLEPTGDPERTRITIPASKYWELVEFLPTGKLREVDSRLDFRKGQPRANLKLDDVLTDLSFENKLCKCTLKDLELGAEVTLGFDDAFREVVVYTPPDNPRLIAIEPYTQTTDAINLASKGVDGGSRILDHDGRSTMRIVVES